jgi:glycosyltransferase involved in cell wall biosynthesis
MSKLNYPQADVMLSKSVRERLPMYSSEFVRQRRRVVHITTGLDTGGQERLLLEFARQADRRWFDLSFISLTTRGRLADEIESLSWPVFALEEPPGFRPSIVWHLAGTLRRLGADIVHTHDSRPLIYGAPAARMAGARHVIHMRHFARLPSLTRRQTWLATMAARLVDCYVCVSEESARIAGQEGVLSRRIRTVWNGIALERFAFAGSSPEGPVVSVARLSPEKDVGTLVHAMAIAVKSRPEIRLEIAGAGPCLPHLRDLTRKLGMDVHIQFLGEVQDVSRLLARARMFVLPSLTEGISLTLLEAMSKGLPVVATRVGGNPEVVMDNETGMLVPPGDASSLAGAILDLYGNPVKSRLLGVAGRRRVEEHFTARRMVEAYETMYESCGSRRMPAVNHQ